MIILGHLISIAPPGNRSGNVIKHVFYNSNVKSNVNPRQLGEPSNVVAKNILGAHLQEINGDIPIEHQKFCKFMSLKLCSEHLDVLL